MTTTPVSVRIGTAADLAWLSARELIPAAAVVRGLDAGEYLIAEREGRAIGFLRVEYLWSTVPYIALIRVDEAQRGHGVGRALLAFLEAHLRANGYTQLLSSSQADEPQPQAWHRHMGFEECGILSGLNAGGVGEIFFRKPL